MHPTRDTAAKKIAASEKRMITPAHLETAAVSTGASARRPAVARGKRRQLTGKGCQARSRWPSAMETTNRAAPAAASRAPSLTKRSEERRAGKEGSCRGAPHDS